LNSRFGTSQAKWLIVVIFMGLHVSSCDLLRTAPFDVVSWNPGPGHHQVADEITVSIMFSEVPDKVSAENSFSLTENGAALSGCFAWLGSALTFMPCGGLRANAEYRITVSADARNPSGVSLEQPFEETFTSRLEDVRPRVISTFPEHECRLETCKDKVTVIFSEAVDAISFRDCVSFSPDNKGIWNLESGGFSAVFTPLEPWAWGTKYNVAISADLLDTSGNRSGNPYTFCYTVGADLAPPILLSAEAIDENGMPVFLVCADEPLDGVIAENQGWEASWKLRLHYSEPVSLRTIASIITGEAGVSLEVDWTGEVARIIDLIISDQPVWGEGFTVNIPAGVEDEAGNASLAESVFRFVFDGLESRPPRFVGIRLPLAPGEPLAENRNLAVFSVEQPYATLAITGDATGYPVGVPVTISIEVYLELALNSEVNILSLMNSFRFSSTNGALEFSAKRILPECLEYAEPHEPWAGFAIVRIDGTLTNHVDSGILTVQLAAGFCDSSGNASGVAQRLTLLK